MPGLSRVPNTASADDVAAILERDGGVVIEAFISPSTLAGLRHDLIPLLERQSTGLNAFSGHSTRRLSALFARTRHCAEIVTHPLYLPVAQRFLSRPRSYWVGEKRREMAADVRIGVTQAIQIWPGQEAQPLHRDDSALLWRHLGDGAEARVQVMVALSDFTAENGGTMVIPGSHTWDEDRKPDVSEAIPTEMSAGSALIWLGSVYHGGGANRSVSPRSGLSIGLDASNLRQEENLYLALAPEVVASYPVEIQRLLGWSAGRNFMGWVEIDGQMADPIELLPRADPAEALV